MRTVTDKDRCKAMGFADGFAAATVPDVAAARPRERVAEILSWPIELIAPEHLIAYFDGLKEGQETRFDYDAGIL